MLTLKAVPLSRYYFDKFFITICEYNGGYCTVDNELNLLSTSDSFMVLHRSLLAKADLKTVKHNMTLRKDGSFRKSYIIPKIKEELYF